MEVEISRNSLDGASYWPSALITDNSHVVHLNVERRAQNWARVDWFLSLPMPQRRDSEECEDLEKSE
jgi:hypothetical protein